jgi:hypothetical protein
MPESGSVTNALPPERLWQRVHQGPPARSSTPAAPFLVRVVERHPSALEGRRSRSLTPR